MRTTVNLDADVQAAVERLRRERGAGVSEIVNELAREGLRARDARPPKPFVQKTYPMGLKIDVSNIAEALEELDGPAAP